MAGSAFPILIAAFALAWPATAAAQEAPPDSTRRDAVRRMLRSDLRNFVTAQEAFFADHVRYAGSMREIASIYRTSRGVTMVLLTSSEHGHSEIAFHADAPDLVCAIYVGDGPPPLGKGDEGEVVCRDPEGGRS